MSGAELLAKGRSTLGNELADRLRDGGLSVDRVLVQDLRRVPAVCAIGRHTADEQGPHHRVASPVPPGGPGVVAPRLRRGPGPAVTATMPPAEVSRATFVPRCAWSVTAPA